MENAHTGNKGDGKVFIYEVEHVIKIKTGELDENGV
jgi:nitrogen regulatory protein PII